MKDNVSIDILIKLSSLRKTQLDKLPRHLHDPAMRIFRGVRHMYHPLPKGLGDPPLRWK